MKTRQRWRRGILLVSFMLFPVIYFYFSPYLSLWGAFSGILTGAGVIFGVQFLSGLFLGRLFCGWVCPAGAAAELSDDVRGKRLRRNRVFWIKYLIWVPWIGLFAFAFLQAGGIHQVDFFFQTDHGVSASNTGALILGLIILGVFVALSLAVGRRAACHTICWMAPFMILGQRVRNLFRWPALHLAGNAEACNSCGRCTRDCQMGLDVQGLVQGESMLHVDCILCGKCVDGCPKSAIHYTFRAGT